MLVTTAVMVMLHAAASGYLVGPAVSLDALTAQADLVVKATVTSESVVKDPWFRELPTYEVRETSLAVVSVLKGDAKGTVRFRHYDQDKGDARASYSPLSYSLSRGRTYLVFAARQADGSYRQLWPAHTQKPDQGVFLAADARPRAAPVPQAVLEELRALAGSEVDADAVYAMQQLDELSGGRMMALADFPRATVLAIIAGSVSAKSPAVATAAITVVAADSPYLDDRQAPYWLTGMGHGHLAGLGPLKPSGRTLPEPQRKALIAVASGTGSAAVRALAVRALGRGVPGALPAEHARWLRDSEPLVRQAAVVLLADAPRAELINAAAADASPEVRVGAARAIGFAQLGSGVPVLGALLADSAAPVREAAALSLLSLDLKLTRPVLEANVGSDYGPLFVNALASADAAPWLAKLGDIVVKQSSPRDWWGGMTPAAESWALIFEYLKARPVKELPSGALDASLDALEKQHWFSSAEPRALYALYLARGMKERAKRFRASCKPGFDMEEYFKMADKDPEAWLH